MAAANKQRSKLSGNLAARGKRSKADERPVRFQLGERDCMVEEVLDQCSDDVLFKVRTDDGNLYILRRNTSIDEWTLDRSDGSKTSRREGRWQGTTLDASSTRAFRSAWEQRHNWASFRC